MDKNVIAALFFAFIFITTRHSVVLEKPKQQAIYSQMVIHHPVWAKNVMVAAGSTQSTLKNEDDLYGASDPRKPNALSKEY